MNAQEAMEHVENLKSELINLPASIDDETHKQIQALSIVLESAKLLHQDILEPSRQTEWRGKADKRLSILYDIPEEGIEILADDLERIGIKEDTNDN